MSSSRPQPLNSFFVRLPNAKSLTQVTFNETPSNSPSSTKFYQCSFQSYQEAKDFLTWADRLKLDFVFTRSLKNISAMQKNINILLPENIYNTLLSKIEELIKNELENDNKKNSRAKTLKSAVSSIKAFGNKIKEKVTILLSRDSSDDDCDDDEMISTFMNEFHKTKELATKLNIPHNNKSILALMDAEEKAQSRARKQARSEQEKYALALAEADALAQQTEQAKQLSIEDAIRNNRPPLSPDEYKRDAFNRIVYPPNNDNNTENSNEFGALSSTRMSTPSL